MWPQLVKVNTDGCYFSHDEATTYTRCQNIQLLRSKFPDQ